MNRKIEFRGKDVKSGEWLYGSYFTDGRWDYIIPQNTFGIQVVPDTVGEFIGKKDKNSTKIFDGDVVRRKDSAYGLEDIGVVRYDCHLCAFVLEYESYGETCQDTFDDEFSEEDGHYTTDGTYSYEVIGNVYDNSDLLLPK